MKKIKLSTTLLVGFLATYSQVFAATGENGIKGLLGTISDLVNTSIGILVTLALAVFFWGLVKYIFHLGGDKAIEGGKRLMIYGVIALFVMTSVWGLVNYLRDFLGVAESPAARVDTILPNIGGR